MILYRPVGLQELALIYESGMKAFPARLPQQPIFYPVLQLEYARQTASGWNTQNGEFAGYVTQFKVEDEYIGQFEEHAVGGSRHRELWIPAEEVDEFNKQITGHIKVLEAYFGEAFQGFIPEQFGLQGKNAIEQFTLLANSYIYKRADFYLEIRRNHKAVFLNYPFWGKHEFKNQGLKEKVLQAIKEAWWTSFPQTPLPLPSPVQEETPHTDQPDAQVPAQDVEDPIQGDILTEDESDAFAYAQRLDDSIREKFPPPRPTYADPLVEPPVQKEVPPVKPGEWPSSVDALDEELPPVKQTDAPAHFVLGIELGLGGKFHQAIEELSQALEEDPAHVTAHTSLGVAFHRLAEDERALACYETSLGLDPIHAEAHYFRANILYSQGNVRQAISGYTLAIGLQPDLIDAHQKPVPQDRLTDYIPTPAGMHRIAKPARRILDLNRSLDLNPRQAKLFKARAAEYYRLRNYVQTIADYSSSLALQPDDADAFHLRGRAYEQLGQREHALEDQQRAMALNPQLTQVYIQRGINFGNVGNFRQSIDSFTEAIRLAPGNPNGYFNRGTTFLQQGDFEKAIDDFSNVIRLAPGDETAYYWRGISYEEAGRKPEATSDYNKFLELSQDANARQEVEQRLRQWEPRSQDDDDITREMLIAKLGRWVGRLGGVSDKRQKTDEVPPLSRQQKPNLDLYVLIAALGERAIESIWLASGVQCDGESAEELYAPASQNQPIEGGDLLAISAGIRQTLAGDFHAFDTGASSHWLLIRAWEGNGFYVETKDSNSIDRLKTHFPWAEEVEGAAPPYASLFIRND